MPSQSSLWPAVVALAAVLLPAASALSCLDENGNAVDWFMAIKHNGGYAYSYADPNNNQLATSPHTLADAAGAITQTLSQSGAFDATYALYDDEPPNKSPYSADGHTKGVLAMASPSSGFWLVHSVPNWPSLSGGVYAGFPASETDYGQSFLCISIGSAADFDVLTDTWMLTRPEFYDTRVTADVQSALPGLADVIANHVHYDEPATNATTMHSAGGKVFTVFSKNSAWNNDLYNALVSPFYDANTYAETWQNGRNALQNFCQPTYKYATTNIKSYTIGDFTMGETKDHSKWCVMDGHYYVCIGGINRQASQYHRGGGTVCFSAPAVSKQLKAQMVLWDTPPRGGCAPAPSTVADNSTAGV